MARSLTSLPKADGFRLPGEFEPKAGCWLGWPERTDVWRNGAKPAQKVWVDIVSAIASRSRCPGRAGSGGDLVFVLVRLMATGRVARFIFATISGDPPSSSRAASAFPFGRVRDPIVSQIMPLAKSQPT
jgi:hypothetical protein